MDLLVCQFGDDFIGFLFGKLAVKLHTFTTTGQTHYEQKHQALDKARHNAVTV